ncbi:MAG TPA: hypothetical protein DEA43_02945 [Candidatus Moranbacteria bacterium]|nr:hypothetical protein [Candidatus Moranbacteria bacterium]HBT45812.1 hypothetical protein [Candidatus Moranbacteria bacterium]
MSWILKNKNKSSKTLLVVFFLLFIFATFFLNNVEAASNVCISGQYEGDPESACQCYDAAGAKVGAAIPAGTILATNPDGTEVTGFCALNACIQQCQKTSAAKAALVGTNGEPNHGSPSSISSKSGNSEVGKAPTIKEAIGGMFTEAIRYFLTQVQALVGWLFAIAATLFAWAIEPANISGENGLLNKPAVKDVWIMVRDILNMTFILILLFAAFCTIFQVEKWNLKKVWLNILINALLVNFSYPIARFFIDISNVAFYYFVNNLFSSTNTVTTTVTGSNIFAMFGSSSSIEAILAPAAFSTNPIAYQIAMIITIFIMGMTLMIIAALFVVRLMALTMLVMFSPIGFVGYIFPSTASFADEWWKKLFAYSFFAPIMIFIMAIALRIAETLKTENIKSMMVNASANTSNDQTTWIANMAFYFIPVVILWMGIGVAQSMKIAGADKVVGAVKKGGNWLATRPWATAKFASEASGVTGGMKLGWDNFKKKGPLFGTDVMEGRAARIGGMLGDKNAVNDVNSKRVKEATEKNAYDQMGPGELRAGLNSEKDKFKRAAMIKALAEHNLASQDDLREVGERYGFASPVFNQLQSKIASYDTAAAFAHIDDEAIRKDRKLAYMDSSKYKAKDQKIHSLASQEDMELAITSGNMSIEELNDHRKKSTQHANAIDASISVSLANPVYSDVIGDDSEHEKHRKLQLAFISQKGTLHESIAGIGAQAQRAAIFDNFNKDTMKRLKWDTLDEFGHEILRGMKLKNIKEGIGSLDSAEKRRFIREIVLAAPEAQVPQIETIKEILKNDPEMKRWARGA